MPISYSPMPDAEVGGEVGGEVVMEHIKLLILSKNYSNSTEWYVIRGPALFARAYFAFHEWTNIIAMHLSAISFSFEPLLKTSSSSLSSSPLSLFTKRRIYRR